MSLIRTVAVLGSGTMGAQIAAHFANAGVPVLLLDLTADIARQGLKRARGLRPDPLFTPDTASLITTGGFDRDFGGLASVDWILEAVVEQLDVKRALIERIEAVRRPDRSSRRTRRAFQLSRIAEGRSDGFPAALAGHALLQPTALPGTPRGDSDRGDRSGCRRTGVRVRRSPPRQRRRRREGHAEFHRQSHRSVRRHRGSANARRRRVHDRGDRRHHRPRARTTEERHVPHDGHRRARRARARRAQSLNAAAGRTKRRRLRCRRWSTR